MQNDETNNLNIGRSSKYLGVSIDTLRRWEKKGKIMAYRSPGGHRYFKKDDLDKLFNTRYERVQIQQSENINLEKPTTSTPISNSEPDKTLNISPLAETPTIATPPVTNPEPRTQAVTPTPKVEESTMPTETHIHLPIPEENFSFTIHPDQTLLLTENPKPELPPAETEIIPASEETKVLENKEDFTMATASLGQVKVEEIKEPEAPSQSIFEPIKLTTDAKPLESVQNTINLQGDEEKKTSLSEIVAPEKPKKESKFFSYAVWGILFFSIIDLIMFFIWFSSTKIISPIP